MSDSTLFEDTFTITNINSEKFDRVSRIYGTSADNTLSMTLDINHELFMPEVGSGVTMVLAQTLNLDGSKDDEKGWRELGRGGTASLADMFDYVCYGKNYRFEDGEGDVLKYFASFGGLLLYIEGPYKKLTGLKIENIYMCLRKS